jgi:hypothetical protein
LRELLIAGFEPAGKWLCTLVHDTMGPDVPALREAFAAVLAMVRFLACMTPLVRLSDLCISKKISSRLKERPDLQIS